MINRYIEIFKNNTILTKQKLESELEMLLNDNTMDIEKKIKKLVLSFYIFLMIQAEYYLYQTQQKYPSVF